MKKLFFLPLLALLSISSCTKNVYEGAQAPATKTPYYAISGVRDYHIVARPQPITSSLSFTVDYTTGAQERVALSMEGLPPRLKLSDSLQAGIPTFSAYAYLIDSGVAEGVYPITLVATSPGAGRRTYTFNYTVTLPPDCTSGIVGNGYNCYSGCVAAPGGTYTQNITAVPGVRNRIQFSGLDNAGLQLYADINCSSQSINIPQQLIGGFTYYGQGYYSVNSSTGARNISLTYYKSNGTGSTPYCQVQMTL